MGCLCPSPAPPQIENASQIINDQKGEQNILLSNKYRQQGRAFFNSRRFADAETVYKLALSYDSNNFLNFTNLALTQKSLNLFSESIKTIQNMEQKTVYIISQGNKAYVVKGKIIKARCQMILAKKIVTSSNATYERDDYKKAKKLAKASLTTLKLLSQDSELNKFTKQLGIDKYLSNAQKINAVISGINISMENCSRLFTYVAERIKTEEGRSIFANSNTKIYFQQPNDILKQMSRWQTQWLKKRFNEKQQQQFTIDPISYEQFQNPIIVQSGLTYQQSVLKNHYSKNGSYDPITRQTFKKQLGVQNKTLQAYIHTNKKPSDLKQLDLLDL